MLATVSNSRPTRGAFIGEIDAIRISATARYAGATLAVPTRLEPDTDTIALWQFDEGAGTTTRDETAFMRDGTIRGATWVLSDR